MWWVLARCQHTGASVSQMVTCVHPPAVYNAHGRVFGDRKSNKDSNTTTLTTKEANTIMSGMKCANTRNTPLQSSSYAMQ